jgi:hypothetical protein
MDIMELRMKLASMLCSPVVVRGCRPAIVRGRQPAVHVQRQEIPYWQQSGWIRRDNRYVGK